MPPHRVPPHRDFLLCELVRLGVDGKILVTTFLRPKRTPKGLLKARYWRRWNVELDVRNIETTLGEDHEKAFGGL
jgi:hypothetical protein